MDNTTPFLLSAYFKKFFSTIFSKTHKRRKKNIAPHTLCERTLYRILVLFISHLLYRIQRIRDAARPKDVPQGVHFVFQFAGDHFSASQFQTYVVYRPPPILMMLPLLFDIRLIPAGGLIRYGHDDQPLFQRWKQIVFAETVLRF